MIGDKVVVKSTTQNYLSLVGSTGTVLHIGERTFSGTKIPMRVKLQGLEQSIFYSSDGHWFWDIDLKKIIIESLQDGYIRCNCGTITTNKRCCECKAKRK